MSILTVAAMVATAANGQVVYDATIGSQLADLPGVRRAVVSYHAYPFVNDDRYEKAVKSAGELWQTAPVVQYDWEPWAIKSTTNQSFIPHIGSIDPHRENVAAIQQRHQTYAEAIAKIVPLAKDRNVRVGIYNFLALVPSRLTDIESNDGRYPGWRAEQDLVLRLPVTIDGKPTTLLSLLNETGGHVWVSWYLPRSRNDPTRMHLTDSTIKAWLRVSDAIEAAGGQVMPVLWPRCAGSGELPAEVDPQIMRRILAAASERHEEFAVWAKEEEVDDEFRGMIGELMNR